jgi:HD-like signal output (HDOD) protein/CheY-like chemotaxis protein
LKSILFVDDDANVLSGLRDLLRSHRKEWEMAFVGGGEEALAKLESRPFDVVVSDMRMPRMDGAALLQKIKDRFPKAVRIILSGQTEMEMAIKTVAIAHQFLSKPCDADQLQEVIRRACDLHQILNDHALQALVGGIAQLPSVPGMYVELNGVLGNPNASLRDVARVIEQDVAMCAKLLQLVNSAFFGLPRRISSVFEAATYLGTLMIRNLALSMGAFSSFASDDAAVTASSEALRRHSVLTANVARSMFADKRRSEDAFMAGMLHDIGHLILFTVPSTVDAAAISPALLGAYLLGLWGIPYPIVEAVAHHDRPTELSHRQFDLPDAVHIAHRLAAQHVPTPNHDAAAATDIDVDYLRALGITAAQMGTWRDLTAKMIRDTPT